jgi:regulator of protease activity HflC (stomatin/prohibitin superfamily)
MSMGQILLVTFAALGALVALAAVRSSVFSVQEAEVAIVTRWGRFVRVATRGFNWKMPFVDRIAGRLSLKITQLDVRVETMTRDNATLTATVSVFYQVKADQARQAFYTMANPVQQITANVNSVILAHMPSIDLADAWRSRDQISDAVTAELSEKMATSGYSINSALVNEIDTTPQVKEAMNRITANQRNLDAAKAAADATYITQVRQAEADAERMALQGNGFRRMRENMAAGLGEALKQIHGHVPGLSESQIVALLLASMYVDELGKFANAGHASTILLPTPLHSLAAGSDEFLQSLLVAQATAAPNGKTPPSRPTPERAGDRNG